MAELKKQEDKEEKISSEDYEHLLDKYQFSAKEITPGKIIKGKVIKATSTGVLMDIGAGEKEPEWARAVLDARDRTVGGITASPLARGSPP